MAGEPSVTAAVTGLAFFCLSFVWLFEGLILGLSGFALFQVFAFLAWTMGGRAFFPLSRIGEPAVNVSSQRVPVGGPLLVAYEQRWKRATEVNSIELQLVVRETVNYGSGEETRTATHSEIVQQVRIPRRRFERGERFRQEYDFLIPPGSMHTFVTPTRNNQIMWYLKLFVDIPRSPDVHREFEIIVLPDLVR
jgi:hypothetical protein